MVQQHHEVALTLDGRAFLGHENRFLERACGPGPPRVLLARVPLVVADDVEQTSCGRSAFLEVVRFGGVDVALPEVIVLLGQHAVIYARELAVDAETTRGLNARVGGRLGVEDPAVGVGDELVALEEGSRGGCSS
jgi:hypothetical protein